MEYKQIKRDNYNIGIINTDRFKSTTIRFYITSKGETKNIKYYNLLSEVLFYCTKKYKNKTQMMIREEELYNPYIGLTRFRFGNMLGFELTLDYINSNYTEENMDEESIDFILELLLNPDLENGVFKAEALEYGKKIIKNKYKNMRESAFDYSNFRFYKEFLKNTIFEIPLMGKENEYDDITSKELYNFYKNVFSSELNIIILSKIKDDKIQNYLEKKLKGVFNKKETINDLFLDNKLKKSPVTIKEKKNFAQSILKMGYKLKDPSFYEISYVLPLFNMILGNSQSSLLFTEVREEQGLCYEIGSQIEFYRRTLVVSAGINRKNYDLAKNTISNIIKDFNKTKGLEKKLEDAKESMNLSFNSFYDEQDPIIHHYFIKNYVKRDDIETRKKKIMNVTIEELKSLSEKLILDTTYFLEGEKENE